MPPKKKPTQTQSDSNPSQYYIEVPEYEIKDTKSKTLLVKSDDTTEPAGNKTATDKYRFALKTENTDIISVKFEKENLDKESPEQEASNANNDYFVPKKIVVENTEYDIKPEISSESSTLAFSASSDANKSDGGGDSDLNLAAGGAPNAISGGVISPKTLRARSRKVYRGKTKHSHKNTEARKSRRWTRLHKKKA